VPAVRARRAAGLILMVAAAAAGQQPPQPATPSFRATVPVVMVPAAVSGSDGKPLDGLDLLDFTVLDNGRPQKFRLDTWDAAATPLAVVVAIQANEIATPANLKVRKTGAMIQPLITGERGAAAVISFGNNVTVEQDFTHQAGAISTAFRGIRAQGGKRARMLDAMSRGVEMLNARPTGERRVLIVIGESRDRGSETALADLVKAISQAAITVYPVVFSTYVTPFTTRTEELPPAPPLDLLAIFTEPARLGKVNVAEVMARETGGRRFGFATLKGLERDLTNLGEELHSEYMVSYPAPAGEPGFHRIEVRVNGRSGVAVRARSGYWSE
jgi:VWFA-related protein